MLISYPTVYIDKFTPAKVPLGHWMAINPDDESEVVASAPELEIAVETAKWSQLHWIINGIKESSKSEKGKITLDRSNRFLGLKKERLKKYRITIEEID